MTNKLIITTGIFLIAMFMFAPVFANEDLNFKQDKLSSLFDEVILNFEPVINDNNLVITKNIPENIPVLDKNTSGESIMSLLCNALVRAPKQANISVNYENGKLLIWVPKSEVAYNVSEKVIASPGITFDYRTEVGKGFELSMNLP